MGKVKRLFACSSCGRPTVQWAGRCAACGEWGTVDEHRGDTGRSAVGGLFAGESRIADLATADDDRRLSTGFPGLDRALGGGLVPGSAVLLAGAPGIGKSTLLLQLASRLDHAGHTCLYASGEEARDQIASRARRLGLGGGGLAYVPGRDLSEVVDGLRSRRPDVLVVDSIQTIRETGSDAVPGGPSQVRLCADALIGAAKDQGTTLLLVGHVTKEGDLAGPRTLEHAVDAVVTFEGEGHSGLRVVTGGKNRYGPEGEVAWMEMTREGLVETDPRAGLVTPIPEPGSATALPLAGRRGLAVEIQVLVVPTQNPPRRQVTGLDPRRFQILAAVVDRVAGRGLSRSDLYASVAGGVRLDDPGVDLAVAVALASAAVNAPPPARWGFAGEVSLTGAVRPVAGNEIRLSAALAAGLDAIVMPAPLRRPADGPPPLRGLAPVRSSPAGDGPSEARTGGPVRVIQVQHLREAIAVLERSPRRAAAG